MDLKEAYKVARIIETLENYTHADNILDVIDNFPYKSQNSNFVYSDEYFWCVLLSQNLLNEEFHFYNVGLSQHIARIPGLFYDKKSRKIRESADSKIEYISNGKWKHYSPSGKTEKVLGGIGTIQLPPENNSHLCSVSTTNNASTGIPVLISEEIWQHHNLKEGMLITELKGRWKTMSSTWSKRFPSTANIPKGYIFLEHLDDIKIANNSLVVPTIFHPFSIMEYEKNGSLFYDYVYVTVDSTEPNYREQIRSFFNEYESFENRYGKYLIEPFVNYPLLNNVQFQSPKELRNSSNVANSHLELLIRRIKGETFKGNTLDNIKIAIDNKCSIDQLKRLSDEIGINPNKWFTGNAVVNESAVFLEICSQRDKVDELIDALIIENPDIFK